jgi:predicted NUDIX family NTP pyrophosphohydrolase
MNHRLKGRENKRTLQNTNKKSMGMLNFSEYINEGYEDINPKLEKRMAAGVAIIYQNKILLVHPTGGTWQRGICGIPKGSMEAGEEPITAALRELREETGIILGIDQLDPSPELVNFYSKTRKVERQLIYFICKIDNLSELGLETERIPNRQLQIEEVDWAKFVTPEEAYSLIARSQLIILDRLLVLG